MRKWRLREDKEDTESPRMRGDSVRGLASQPEPSTLHEARSTAVASVVPDHTEDAWHSAVSLDPCVS